MKDKLPLSRSSNVILVSVVLTVLILIGLILLSFYITNARKKVQVPISLSPTQVEELASPDQTLESLPTEFFTETAEWERGSRQELTIRMSDQVAADKLPHAFSITLNYDPEALSLVSAKPGGIWTSSNNLEEKIDEDAGLIKVSYGMAFEAEMGETRDMLHLTFDIIAPQATTTEIVPLAREAARVGHDSMIRLELDSFQLELQ